MSINHDFRRAKTRRSGIEPLSVCISAECLITRPNARLVINKLSHKTIYRFLVPWHWMKNCLERSYGQVFRFFGVIFPWSRAKKRKTARYNTAKLDQGQRWQRPAIETQHVKMLRMPNSFTCTLVVPLVDKLCQCFPFYASRKFCSDLSNSTDSPRISPARAHGGTVQYFHGCVYVPASTCLLVLKCTVSEKIVQDSFRFIFPT